MPFIVDPEKFLTPIEGDWERIELEAFLRYRKNFVERHEGLRGIPKIDVDAEIKKIVLPQKTVKFIQGLLENFIEGEYLVGQYICGADYSNLQIAFCKKVKKSDAQTRDTLLGKEFCDSQGNSLDKNGLKTGMANFHNRKGAIFDSGNEEFEIDKKGRAHGINKSVETFFKTDTPIYVYYIIDSIGLSFAFSQLDLEMQGLVDDGIYDHGSGCCPIG